MEKCEGIFGTEICKRIGNKYNRRLTDGMIEGYGKNFLAKMKKPLYGTSSRWP